MFEFFGRLFGGKQVKLAGGGAPAVTTSNFYGQRKHAYITYSNSYGWQIGDDELAVQQARAGQFRMAARLAKDSAADGFITGPLGQRIDGLLRLPLKVHGDSDFADLLRGTADNPPLFWQMFPRGEFWRWIFFGIMIGVGIAEMCEGFEDPDLGEVPVMHTLDGEFYQHNILTNQWSYAGLNGLEELQRGTGRYMFFFPYGEDDPIALAKVRAVGHAFIRRREAELRQQLFSRRKAEGLIAIENQNLDKIPTDRNRVDAVEEINAGSQVITLNPGETINFQDTSGTGYNIYQQQIDNTASDAAIALTGQKMTTEGNDGFSDGSEAKDTLFAFITNDARTSMGSLVQDALEPFCEIIGEETPMTEFDTTPPNAKKLQAETDKLNAEAAEMRYKAAAAITTSIDQINNSLVAKGIEKQIDLVAAIKDSGFDLIDTPASSAVTDTASGAAASAPIFAYHIDRGVVTINEVRKTLGLPDVSWGDKPATAPKTDTTQNPEDEVAQAIARSISHAELRMVMARAPGDVLLLKVANDHLVNWQGVDVRIEYPEGSERSGIGADGEPWKSQMVGASYGSIRGSMGNDGEALDVYVGPSKTQTMAFVLEQLRADGTIDEYKIFLGFDTAGQARACWLRHVPLQDRCGDVYAVPIDVLRGMIGARGSVATFARTIKSNIQRAA